MLGETPTKADLIKEGTDQGFAADVVEASQGPAGDRRLLGHLVRSLQARWARRSRRPCWRPRARSSWSRSTSTRTRCSPASCACSRSRPSTPSSTASPSTASWARCRRARSRPSSQGLVGQAGPSDLDLLLDDGQGRPRSGRHRRRGPAVRPGAASGAGQRQGDRRPRPLLSRRRRLRARQARSSPWRPRTPRTPTSTACARRWRWLRRRRPRPPVSSSASPLMPATTRRASSSPRRSLRTARWPRRPTSFWRSSRRDRNWNDEAARKQLLTVFEAAGATSEVAKSGPAAAVIDPVLVESC